MDENEILTGNQVEVFLEENDLKIENSPLVDLVNSYNEGIREISVCDNNRQNGYYLLQKQLEKILVKVKVSKDSAFKAIAKKIFDIIKSVKIVAGYNVPVLYEG